MIHKNNKGFVLIELIAAVSISTIVILTALYLFNTITQSWSHEESKLNLSYIAKDTIDKLTKEISEGNSAQILDSSDKGWLKIYKTKDNSQFVTFRLKKNKIFIGLKNTEEDPKTEYSNCIKVFRVKYYPEGCEQKDAKGINIYLEFGDNKNNLNLNTNITFRNI